MRIDKSSSASAPIRWMQSTKKPLRRTINSRRAGSPKKTRNDDNDALRAGRKSSNDKQGAKVQATSSRKKTTSSDRRRNSKTTSRARSRSRSRSRKTARSRSRNATRSRSRKASRSRSRKPSRSRAMASRRNDESRESTEVQRTTRDTERKPSETPWTLLPMRSLPKTRTEQTRSFGKATSETRIVRRPSMPNFGFLKNATAEVNKPGETRERDGWRGNITSDSKRPGDSPYQASVSAGKGQGNQVDNKNVSEYEKLPSPSSSEDGGIELIAMINTEGKPFTRIVVEKDAGFQKWNGNSGNKNHVPLEESNGTKLPFFKNDPVDKPTTSRTKKFLNALPWRQRSKAPRNQKSEKIEIQQKQSCLVSKEPSLPIDSKTSPASPEGNKQETEILNKRETKESELWEEESLDAPPKSKDTETGFELIATWMKDGQDSTKSSDSKPKNPCIENEQTESTREPRSSDFARIGRHQPESSSQVVHPRIPAGGSNGSTGSHEILASSMQDNDVTPSMPADDRRTTNLHSSVLRNSPSVTEQRDSSVRRDSGAGTEQRDSPKLRSESNVPVSSSQLHKEPKTETESRNIKPLDVLKESSVKDKPKMHSASPYLRKAKTKLRDVHLSAKSSVTERETANDFQPIYRAPSRRREPTIDLSFSDKGSVGSSYTSGTADGRSASADWDEDGTTGDSTINTIDSDEDEAVQHKVSLCTSASSSRLSSALGNEWEIISVLDNPSIYDEETGTVDSNALMRAIDSADIYSLGSGSTAEDIYSASEGSLTRVNHALDTIKRYATRHGIPERELLEAVASTARSRAISGS